MCRGNRHQAISSKIRNRDLPFEVRKVKVPANHLKTVVAFPEAKIRIIAIPPGEAPFEIREQWVGLILPLAGGMPCAWQMQTVGVLTGTIDEDTIGYPVDSNEAMTVLAEKSLEAVKWWKTNTPDLFEEGGVLVFHEHVWRLIS
jgi:hypothetical protein